MSSYLDNTVPITPSVTPPLGQLLLNAHAITSDELDAALRYKKEHSGTKLGEALIAIGALNEGLLNRTLRKQRWLRAATTFTALLSPLSLTYALDSEDHTMSGHNTWATHWHLKQEDRKEHSENERAIRILSTAYDLYLRIPEAGKWRYGLSETESGRGYQIDMTIFF